MKRALEGYPSDFASPGRVDPEVAERLKALGYVSESVPTRDDEGLPNPRDRVHVHEKLKHANRLVVEGRTAEALAELRSLIAEDPGFFEARRDLAGTLALAGPIPGGRGRLQGGHAGLSPRLAGSVALPLGLVELEMGQLAEAEARAQAALPDDPGRAHQLLARVALARGDLATAEAQARLAMADASAESEGALLLAQVHVARSQLPEALAVIEKARARALEQGRNPPTGLEPLRADVLGRLGRFAEAEAVLRQDILRLPEKGAVVRHPRRRAGAPGPAAKRGPGHPRVHGEGEPRPGDDPARREDTRLPGRQGRRARVAPSSGGVRCPSRDKTTRPPIA